MSLFTPISGLIGGSLIGISSAVLLLGNGDIMGASGLCSSVLLKPKTLFLSQPETRWKVVFIGSFLIATNTYIQLVEKSAIIDSRLAIDPDLPIVSTLGHCVAGFLVGLGTKLSNGCTTGHGIAGLARMSKRSLVAVLSFMLSGFLSASICNPMCPLAKYLRAEKEFLPNLLPTESSLLVAKIVTATFACLSVTAFLMKSVSKKYEDLDETNKSARNKYLPAALSGAIFSVGLAISTMIKSSKIYGFLDLTGFSRGTYDPTLITVMGGGLVWSFLAYQFVEGHNTFSSCKTLKEPLSQRNCRGSFTNVPTNKTIDSNLIAGSILFGVGWGIGGLCPGPAMFLAGAGFPMVLYRWWPCFFLGSFFGEKIKG